MCEYIYLSLYTYTVRPKTFSDLIHPTRKIEFEACKYLKTLSDSEISKKNGRIIRPRGIFSKHCGLIHLAGLRVLKHLKNNYLFFHFVPSLSLFILSSFSSSLLSLFHLLSLLHLVCSLVLFLLSFSLPSALPLSFILSLVLSRLSSFIFSCLVSSLLFHLLLSRLSSFIFSCLVSLSLSLFLSLSADTH